jgi:hypothetical protein
MKEFEVNKLENGDWEIWGVNQYGQVAHGTVPSLQDKKVERIKQELRMWRAGNLKLGTAIFEIRPGRA